MSHTRPNEASQGIDQKISRLSFWSAATATIALIFSGITATTALKIPALISGMLLIPAFIILMACIHDFAPRETKIYSRIGLLFAVGYSVLIGFNYYMQLTMADRSIYSASFNMKDPNSTMWVIEVLGYGFMGLSTLAAAWVFRSGILEKLVRWLFVVNGMLGLGGMIGYALHWNMKVLLGGLILWDIIMPLSTILLAVLFRKRQHRG